MAKTKRIVLRVELDVSSEFDISALDCIQLKKLTKDIVNHRFNDNLCVYRRGTEHEFKSIVSSMSLDLLDLN
jgi:hypothetical protein